MKAYSTKTFTFGYEIEFGDVDRRLTIPPELGKWESAETDIVNLRHPYALVACDPLGLVPPMGGEINTVPTTTWEAQVERILKIIEFFRIKQTKKYSDNPQGYDEMYADVNDEVMSGLQETMRQNAGVAFTA